MLVVFCHDSNDNGNKKQYFDEEKSVKIQTENASYQRRLPSYQVLHAHVTAAVFCCCCCCLCCCCYSRLFLVILAIILQCHCSRHFQHNAGHPLLSCWQTTCYRLFGLSLLSSISPPSHPLPSSFLPHPLLSLLFLSYLFLIFHFTLFCIKNRTAFTLPRWHACISAANKKSNNNKVIM